MSYTSFPLTVTDASNASAIPNPLAVAAAAAVTPLPRGAHGDRPWRQYRPWLYQEAVASRLDDCSRYADRTNTPPVVDRDISTHDLALVLEAFDHYCQEPGGQALTHATYRAMAEELRLNLGRLPDRHYVGYLIRALIALEFLTQVGQVDPSQCRNADAWWYLGRFAAGPRRVTLDTGGDDCRWHGVGPVTDDQLDWLRRFAQDYSDDELDLAGWHDREAADKRCGWNGLRSAKYKYCLQRSAANRIRHLINFANDPGTQQLDPDDVRNRLTGRLMVIDWILDDLRQTNEPIIPALQRALGRLQEFRDNWEPALA